jgi:hypothetical protein
MYRVPSEFIKQKQVLFWFITVEQVLGAFAGFLLAQALGGATPVLVVAIALGLAATTLKVQGITVYRFAPLAIAYAVRKLTGNDWVEPEDIAAAAPQGAFTLLDEDGRPIVFQER